MHFQSFEIRNVTYVSYFVYFSDLKTIYSYFITIILIEIKMNVHLRCKTWLVDNSETLVDRSWYIYEIMDSSLQFAQKSTIFLYPLPRRCYMTAL